MRRTYRKKKPKLEMQYRANRDIRVPEVRVIDENDEMLNVMETSKALAMAEERGYDLVEVSPKANPPVVKFLNYGSFKYQQEKIKQKQKQKVKKIDIKNIRLSPRMSEHDEEVRLKQAIKFLHRGDKIKIELGLKGREHRFGEIAKERIENFINNIKESDKEWQIDFEEPIKKMGGKFIAIIYNKLQK